MIDFSRNHFALFGLPERYRCATDALDHAYRTLQAEVHPDRWAGASETERRLALQASARVNEAYRTLKDPVARVEYLLALRAEPAMGSADRSLPLDFLELQLERRERAAEAERARDIASLDALLADVRADARQLEDRLAGDLDAGTVAVGRATRVTAREFRFLAKLAEDLNAMIAGLDE